MTDAATAILVLAGAYAVIGLGVAIAFVVRGVDRVDLSARGSGFGFRLIVLPACALLWPWVAARWWRAVGARPASGARGSA
jgi:hypothetical protein